jgi:hypothetical protein
MAVDGDAAAASALFTQGWESRRDDYEASIAAHFVARHQPTAADTLHWNRIAVEHAESVPDDRARPLLASLYLNLADSLLDLGYVADASAAADRGIAALEFLPAGGYRELTSRGLQGLLSRIGSVKLSGAQQVP